jgi:hypothetical protein
MPGHPPLTSSGPTPTQHIDASIQSDADPKQQPHRALLFQPITHPPFTSQTITMSDIENEMDVDVPPSHDIRFSSDNTAKGKRSAANLPVEAEDSLPW